ncbi:MAG: transglutaminase family protein [Deltaproteobacteria bacterium]|nr:transglutaminase family protein [Deltaproteobacteria bacterium]
MKPVDEVYLRPTYFIDSNHQNVIAYANSKIKDKQSEIEKAVALYLAVRDDILYTPYGIDLSRRAMKASSLLKEMKGFCIPKAILLAASARVVGIPSRLGFSDVKNHISSERFRSLMQTDVYFYHGYTELFLEGKWVKATPAFNRSLCDKLQVKPLEFNGYEDSLFQQYNSAGGRYMEYIKEHGHFVDFPYDEIIEAFKSSYPLLIEDGRAFKAVDFEGEVKRENN